MNAPRRPGDSRARRWSPLVFALVASLVTVFVLPSALNLPSSDPPQTLEFAPVPPDEDRPPPETSGDVGQLGLGTTSTGPTGDVTGPDGLPLMPPPVEGVGARPVTKRCVGMPPRQTEDPLAPPCVAHFEGDNDGATARGVSAGEVRILVYFDLDRDPSCDTSSRGVECKPPGTIIDLHEEADEDEFIWVRVLRWYQQYFNDRFQTYGRRVHLWVQFGDPATTPESIRADAARGLEEVDPFAVVAFPSGNPQDYVAAMAEAGVVTFLGDLSGAALTSIGEEAATFRQWPALLWSWTPSLEQRARLFSSYVCTKVVPHRVSFSGNDDDGEPRVLGIVTTSNETRTDLLRYSNMVRTQIEACGGEFEAEATWRYPRGGGTPPPPNEAVQNLAAFQQAGVTTVIWLAGTPEEHTAAGDTIEYYPEFVVGDAISDQTGVSQLQPGQETWSHAVAVTTRTPLDFPEQQVCSLAAWEANPNAPFRDVTVQGCDLYNDMLQLFIGIQVAGPRLTVESMDKGFHAIPAIRSDDPFVPACFYDPGDYTCVKDAAVGRWWPDGENSNGQRGCWQMVQAASRHLAGSWPDGDVTAQWSEDDPCRQLGRPTA